MPQPPEANPDEQTNPRAASPARRSRLPLVPPTTARVATRVAWAHIRRFALPLTRRLCRTLSLALLIFVSVLLVSSPSASIAAPLVWSAPVHVDTLSAITSVSCPATNFCAAVDRAKKMLTSDPASSPWPVTGTDIATPLSVSCGSASFCALGDSGGSAVSYSNGSWGARIAPPGQSFGINAVSCASSVFCLGGSSVTTTPKTLDGGATWVVGNPQGVNYPGQITAVSCVPGSDASTGFCVVVDGSRAAFPSSNGGVSFLPGNRPDGVISGASQLNSVSCTSSTSCVTVDSAGRAFYYRGGVLGGADWTAVNADLGRQLKSVSCVLGSPSPQTFCAAVDSGGYQIETSDGGTTWSTPAKITGTTGTPPLNSVSCATARFCVAVDNGGNAYTGAPQAAPTNTGTAPAVSNLPAQVGQSPPLSCSDAGAVWTGPSPSITYRWQSSASSSGTWADIALDGASQTYSPVSGDAGSVVRCVVTATNAGGATDANSAATDAVLQAAAPPALPGVSVDATETPADVVDVSVFEPMVPVGLKALSTQGPTLNVPMWCPVAVTCTGDLVLDHFTPVVPRADAARRRGRHHKTGRIVLGTARFSLAGESSRSVTIRLAKVAQEMLSGQRGHVIHVTLRASVSATGYAPDVVGRYFRLTSRR
jgi:hypothetical protein